MTTFKEYLKITIGLFLVAISVKLFLAPNQLTAGGVSGMAIIINHFLPNLPIGLLTLIMNVILFIVAFFIIGGKFGTKTIYASLVLSTLIWIMDFFIAEDVALTKDLMLASIFGTFCSGIGMAIVFNENASTGGTDIIAKIINKFFHIAIGKSLLGVDFIITVLGAITFGIDQGLYSLLAVIINGVIIDYAIDGFNVCKQVMIITRYKEEVGRYITETLDRSYTILFGRGGFSEKEVDVIYTILTRVEYINLKKYIISIDKQAFISVNDSHEVLGEGFSELIED
ncbi:YitT family protein [Clostridium sp. N3C]|uniref:YitT family protein n=1 Tax=Clostridium sp. N3C TaxID=1776758 RepID=UPI000944CC14|nr:YitT family protein [Clostridium sp. N3C]